MTGVLAIDGGRTNNERVCPAELVLALEEVESDEELRLTSRLMGGAGGLRDTALNGGAPLENLETGEETFNILCEGPAARGGGLSMLIGFLDGEIVVPSRCSFSECPEGIDVSRPE